MQLAAGIDTWSLAWYPRPAEVARMRELATSTAARGRWLPAPVDGHRVGVFDSGMVAAEGHPVEGRLARAAELRDAASRLSDAIAEVTEVELGTRPRAFAGEGFHGLDGVRRLDAAVDLVVERHEGLSVLAALSAAQPPTGLEVVSHRGKHSFVQSVAWQGRRGRPMRAYDKSVEACLGPPGTVVRLERQQRWPAGSRREVDELDGRYVGEHWARRFVPLWRATKGVRVMTNLRELCERVHELTLDGELTPMQGVDVLGHLVLEATGSEIGRSRPTRWRHRRLAQDHGLVLVGADVDGVEVDVHELLERAIENDAIWTD